MRDRFIKIGLSLPFVDLAIIRFLRIYGAQSLSEGKIEIPNDVLKNSNDCSQKWIIQTSVPRNQVFENWGDYSFAQEIATALIEKGQSAFVAFRTDDFELNTGDTYLVLRGLYPFKPKSNAKNLIWIISHPNQISKRELQGFNTVFAASSAWAKLKSKKFGQKIIFLPQATNPKKFYPSETPKRIDITFVGNAISRRRKIVLDVIKLGFEVKVIGKGWAGKIPSEMILADFIKNDELGELYRNSCIVLNDHWKDMKKFGFVSNRVLDGVASGAMVISDQIDYDEELPNFRTYMNLRELEFEISNAFRKCKEFKFVDNLGEFGKSHSFENRVETLMNLG